MLAKFFAYQMVWCRYIALLVLSRKFPMLKSWLDLTQLILHLTLAVFLSHPSTFQITFQKLLYNSKIWLIFCFLLKHYPDSKLCILEIHLQDEKMQVLLLTCTYCWPTHINLSKQSYRKCHWLVWKEQRQCPILLYKLDWIKT